MNCQPQLLRPAPASSTDGDGSNTPGAPGKRALAPNAATATATPPPPLLELAFARANPRLSAELMAQAFVTLHAAGRVVRERTLFAMYVRR